MKRFADHHAGGSAEKRAKHIADDLWGDSDPDIDDFLVQASQIVDEIPAVENNHTNQIENDSYVSYNGFNKTSMLASTQLDASIWAHPATSSRLVPNGSGRNNVITTKSHDELQQLREQVLSKEGEITILRTQLKQSREQAEQSTSRRMNETFDQLHTIKKDRDKISTELDFKNLEIVNLKRKLENITKNLFETFNRENSTIVDNSKIAAESTKLNSQSLCDDNGEEKMEPVSGTKFPLKYVIPLKIFESIDDDKFPKVLYSKQTTDERYLHSLMFPNCQGQQDKGIFTYIRFGEPLKIKHFFETIRFLRDSSDWQLEIETNAINQIYLLTLTLLTNHLEYLTKFAKLVKKDEIREHDLQNLLNPHRNVSLNVPLLEPITCDNSLEECAMQCRQCIALLAAIYPHNKHLRNVITNNKLPQSSERDKESWPFTFSNILVSGNEQNLLKVLHRIVKIIGDTRRGDLYAGLLCATCCLLAEIVQFNQENNKTFEQIGRLVAEIVLTTPSYAVLYHMSELFRHGSTCLPFIEQLCKNPRTNVQKKTKRDVVLVNESCCIIDVYFSLCRLAFSHILGTDDLDFRMVLNLMQFVTNSINCNVRWMHFESDKRHLDCQKEYYRLTIEMMYASLLIYRVMKGENKYIPVEIRTIIKTSPKVLGTLIRKYGDMIEYNVHYSAMMKSARALLIEMQDKFDGWNQFEVETIAIQSNCESSSPPPPTISWDLLSLDSLKFS